MGKVTQICHGEKNCTCTTDYKMWKIDETSSSIYLTEPCIHSVVSTLAKRFYGCQILATVGFTAEKEACFLWAKGHSISISYCIACMKLKTTSIWFLLVLDESWDCLLWGQAVLIQILKILFWGHSHFDFKCHPRSVMNNFNKHVEFGGLWYML